MALSKEFYLDEIRSKYPNSYNEGLKDLPVKDLEDMLDFLDQALGKADGGAIGIEVLFTDKKPRKNFSNGGDSDKNTKEFQNKYIQAAIKLASDKNIGIGDAMMITSDEDFDIDSMEYKGSSEGILEILNQKADGGRVGLFMGGPALEGTALNIYESMNAYGFSDQEIANALEERGLYTPTSSGTTQAGSGTTTQPEQVTGIINQQLQTGGGDGSDGPKGDFGIFGNLDKSTAKDFNVEVYDEEVGDFVPTTITGYKNVSSGLYQDKFGKNLQPMFSNTGMMPGGFAGAVLSLAGMKPKTVGGFVPGSIRGKYDGIRDIFNKQKKQQQDIIKKQLEEKAKKEREAKAAIAAAEKAKKMQQENRDNTTGGYQFGYSPTSDFMTGGGGGERPGGGNYGGGADKDLSSVMGSFKRGGLATMFTRRR